MATWRRGKAVLMAMGLAYWAHPTYAEDSLIDASLNSVTQKPVQAPAPTPAFIPPKVDRELHRTNLEPKGRIYASGQIILSEQLAAAANGFREVYIELYTANGSGPLPYAWTKYLLKQDPSGSFLNFTLSEGNLHFTTSDVEHAVDLPIIKVRLTKYGMMGMESPGDLVGMVGNVKPGETKLKIIVGSIVQSNAH